MRCIEQREGKRGDKDKEKKARQTQRQRQRKTKTKTNTTTKTNLMSEMYRTARRQTRREPHTIPESRGLSQYTSERTCPRNIDRTFSLIDACCTENLSQTGLKITFKSALYESLNLLFSYPQIDSIESIGWHLAISDFCYHKNCLQSMKIHV